MTLSNDEVVWIVLALATGLIGWIFFIERRVAQKMSFQDHEEICEQKHEEIKMQLVEIKALISGVREDFEVAGDRQEIMGNRLTAVETKIDSKRPPIESQVTVRRRRKTTK